MIAAHQYYRLAYYVSGVSGENLRGLLRRTPRGTVQHLSAYRWLLRSLLNDSYKK